MKNSKNSNPDNIMRIIGVLMDDGTTPEVKARLRLWLFSDRDVRRKQDAFVRYAEGLELDSEEITQEWRRSYNKLAAELGLRPVGKDERILEFRPVRADLLRRPAQRLRRRVSPHWARVAAVLAPVLVLLGTWFVLDNPFAAQRMNIAMSQQSQSAFLPDSTHVAVSPGSTVDYREKNGRRVAELSGETFFKVRRDGGKPFVVSTPSMNVDVLGTEFSVREFPGEAESVVSLFEGRVDVETKGNTIALTRGERLVLNLSTGEVVVSAIAPSEMSENGYKPGLRFEGATFRQVLDALAAYHGVEIEVAGGTDVSGGDLIADFEGYSLDEALELLLRTAGGRWRFDTVDGRVVITESK